MPRSSSHPLVAVLLSTGALTAQTTWVVDALNRPGTHFLDVPPAVAQASPGDTIVVRYVDPLTHPYTAPTIQKRLVLLGQGGRPGFLGDLTIQNLPLGQHVALRDFELAPFAAATQPSQGNCHLHIRSNLGTVHLTSVTRGALAQSPAAANLWVVDGCTLVEFESCSFRQVGTTGTCRVQNTGSVTIAGSSLQSTTAATAPLLTLVNTEVCVADTPVLGSATATAPVIDLCNTTLRLAGSSTTVLSPGTGGGVFGSCSGTVSVGSGAFLGQASGVSVSLLPVPALGGLITAAQVLRVTLYGESLGIGLLAVGPPLPVSAPLFSGSLWLDPFQSGSIALVSLDFSGRGVWQVPLGTTLPTGDTAWLQAVVIGFASGFLLTPPVVVIGP